MMSVILVPTPNTDRIFFLQLDNPESFRLIYHGMQRGASPPPEKLGPPRDLGPPWYIFVLAPSITNGKFKTHKLPYTVRSTT